jgi:hypothetical protein
MVINLGITKRSKHGMGAASPRTLATAVLESGGMSIISLLGESWYRAGDTSCPGNRLDRGYHHHL